MITNRRRERTVTLPAGADAALVGRDASGAGGREGVLNGGRRARLNLTNGIAEDLSVYLYSRATRGATPVVIGVQTLPASDSLSVILDESDCAAYELYAEAGSAAGGDVVVDWTVMR